MRSSDPTPSAADFRAFDQHLDHVNSQRMSVLVRWVAGAFAFVIVLSLAEGLPWRFFMTMNALGLIAAGLALAVERWSGRPGLGAWLFGYLVLFWGDLHLLEFDRLKQINPGGYLYDYFVMYFITRYLAAVAVLWRPRELAIALAVNHAAVFWWWAAVGNWSGPLVTGIWVSTAWLAALVVHRAQRDAFFANLALQRQRDQLTAANARLTALNQEKDDLMAIAAHDLRSPLTVMTTLLNMAAVDAAKVWASGVSTLRALEESGREMAALVTRVLDAHQLESRFSTLSMMSGDVAAVVTKAMAPHSAVAQSKGITLDVRAQDPVQAMHDPDALARVIDNLASNAIKFSPPGGGVRVVVTSSANGDHARIEITDSGPGIADADRPRLFRKFARLRAKPTAGESSSGLGLYIVQRLVDAMGGSIEAVNAPGNGASFTVTLTQPASSGSSTAASR